MKQQEILIKERDRVISDDYNKIYVNDEGKFVRAYEYSAFIIKSFVCSESFQKDRGDDKMLSVTHTVTKNNDYVFVGFPIESLAKYIPDYISMSTDSENKVLTFEVNIPEGVTANKLKEEYSEWKKKIPVAESRDYIKSGNSIKSEFGRSGIFAIIVKILSYPLEKKSPTETIEFLSGIKRELINIL